MLPIPHGDGPDGAMDFELPAKDTISGCRRRDKALSSNATCETSGLSANALKLHPVSIY